MLSLANFSGCGELRHGTPCPPKGSPQGSPCEIVHLIICKEPGNASVLGGFEEAGEPAPIARLG